MSETWNLRWHLIEVSALRADHKELFGMPQFTSTIKQIQDGVKGFSISAAVKNIEGWEETLKEMDTPSAKGYRAGYGAA